MLVVMLLTLTEPVENFLRFGVMARSHNLSLVRYTWTSLTVQGEGFDVQRFIRESGQEWMVE